MTGKKWFRDAKARKLAVMILLTACFMVVEIAFGIVTNSLALISDGFHMLSDAIGLVVGVAARIYSWKDRSAKMSYGFRRSETVGAFANGVFLLAICLFIVLDAIQRFIDPPRVQNPVGILIVGGIGLAVNIAGLVLFHGHGGHSHGAARDATTLPAASEGPVAVLVSVAASRPTMETTTMSSDIDVDTMQLVMETEIAPTRREFESQSVVAAQAEEIVASARATIPAAVVVADTGDKKHSDLNLHGVFLHVLGDALGSVGVLLSGLCILYIPYDWKYYVDPIVSVLIALIILRGSVPLVREAGRVLLQAAPKHVDLTRVAADIAQVGGVVGLHELHCWLLADNTAVASLHVKCPLEANFTQIARDITEKLHAYRIHSATIQPEYVRPESEGPVDVEACEMICSPTCNADRCCPPSQV